MYIYIPNRYINIHYPNQGEGKKPMTELEALKQRAKELGKKPDKKFVEIAKAIDRMREIFKEAGLSPFKEYMKDKHGK